MSRSLRYLVPLAVFLGIALFLFRGLGIDPRKVPSPLVGKPAPSFSLPELRDPNRNVSNQDLLGQVSLLNVWATWCVSCRAEHQELMRIAREDAVQIIGLNYKDDRAEAQQWLKRLGDPYRMNAFDQDGRAGIDWGVYGTPETFLIDPKGIVRYKHIGPVDRQVWEGTLRPLIQQLKAES